MKPSTALVADMAILVAFTIIKTYYYFKASRTWSLRRWFYFNHYEMVNASSQKILKMRKLQNRFSLAFIIILVLSGLLFFAVSKEMI